MLVWLIPVSLFFVLAALYLGGFPITIVGGNGFRQMLSLVVTLVIYLAVWGLVRRGMGAVAHNVGTELILPTAIAVLLLPLATRLGFLVLGMRIAKDSAAAH